MAATFHEKVLVYWQYLSEPILCSGISHFDHAHLFGIIYIYIDDETTTKFVVRCIYKDILTCGLLELRGRQCTDTAS